MHVQKLWKSFPPTTQHWLSCCIQHRVHIGWEQYDGGKGLSSSHLPQARVSFSCIHPSKDHSCVCLRGNTDVNCWPKRCCALEFWITGALGAPFLLEDPANQFLHLKRHIYLQDYWDPAHNPNLWENTLADQVFAWETNGLSPSIFLNRHHISWHSHTTSLALVFPFNLSWAIPTLSSP